MPLLSEVVLAAFKNEAAGCHPLPFLIVATARHVGGLCPGSAVTETGRKQSERGQVHRQVGEGMPREGAGTFS